MAREQLDVPLVHEDDVLHRRLLGMAVNTMLPRNGSKSATHPVRLLAVNVADLPDAEQWEGGIVFVADETGGAVLAFSDGSDWRRVTDRAVVS